MIEARSDRLWLTKKYAPKVLKEIPPELRTAAWFVRDSEDGKLEFKFDLNATDPLIIRRMYNRILAAEEASFPELKVASGARQKAISADIFADDSVIRLKESFKEKQKFIPATKKQISGLWYDFEHVVAEMKPDSILGSLMAVNPTRWDIPSLVPVLIQAWRRRYSENADLQKQAKAYPKEILACAEIYVSYQKRLRSIHEGYITPFRYFDRIEIYDRAIEVAQKKLQGKLQGIESAVNDVLNPKRTRKNRPRHPRPDHLRREEMLHDIHTIESRFSTIDGAESQLQREMQHQLRRALKRTVAKPKKPRSDPPR